MQQLGRHQEMDMHNADCTSNKCPRPGSQRATKNQDRRSEFNRLALVILNHSSVTCNSIHFEPPQPQPPSSRPLTNQETRPRLPGGSSIVPSKHKSHHFPQWPHFPTTTAPAAHTHHRSHSFVMKSAAGLLSLCLFAAGAQAFVGHAWLHARSLSSPSSVEARGLRVTSSRPRAIEAPSRRTGRRVAVTCMGETVWSKVGSKAGMGWRAGGRISSLCFSFWCAVCRAACVEGAWLPWRCVCIGWDMNECAFMMVECGG